MNQRNQERKETGDDPGQRQNKVAFGREASFKDALKAGILEDLHAARREMVVKVVKLLLLASKYDSVAREASSSHGDVEMLVVEMKESR